MEDKEILQAIKQIIMPLENDIKDMKSEMKDMKNDIKDMKVDIQDIKVRLENVETEVIKTNTQIEDQIIPGIQILGEGYKGLYEIINVWKKEYDETAETVLALDILHMKNNN